VRGIITDPPAEVRPAANLKQLAARVRQREAKSFRLTKEQALDVLAARQQARRGQWGPWCKEAGLSQQHAWRYVELGKSLVTSGFSDLSEGEQWAEWQLISGNRPPDDEDEDDTPTPRPPSSPPAREPGRCNGQGHVAEPAAPVPSPPESPDDGVKYLTVPAWKGLKAAEKKRVLAADGQGHFNAQETNSIEWALWSWNPVTGCEHNCPYCYARDIAIRFFPPKFEPALWPGRLKAPQNTPFPEEKAAAWMGHKNVFVCSIADLFGRWVPKEWIEAVLAECRAAPRWNFLFLTKFPIGMAEFDFPDNAWVGTTVDCQARVANAERAFRKVKAGVKWLSCEPLLGPLRFNDLSAFQWIVLGGASKSSGTPEWHPPRRWVRELEDEADRLSIPFYEKSNLSSGRVRGYPGQAAAPEPAELPPALRYLPGDGSPGR
jgi:protein gp37